MSLNKVKKEMSSEQPETILVEDDDDICELEHLRKLFIGGLAPYTTEESLKEFYSQYGKVVDVVVMRDPTSKRSRGFGFITYTKSSMVDKAQENRPHVVDGKSVEAKRALPRPERESRESNLSVKKLFVGGLKDNHDEQCLEEYFTQFGKVISVKILTDKTTSKRRGFAFVEFDDYDSVDKAILQKTHSIKYVLVDVKKSVYKQENRNTNNNNMNNMNNSNMNGNKPPPNKMPMNTQNGYRGPMPPAQGMQPYPPQPPINGGPPPPSNNYNYWGPPPPAMQPPYGYHQPPGPPQMNWNYPPSQPGPWQNGPPSGPPNWYPTNQWGGPPPAPGVPPPQVPPVAPVIQPAVPGNWSGPPQIPPVQVPPVAGPPGNVPPPIQPPVQAPQVQTPPNFGTGYQQSYGGGPSKNNMHTNRMNPYGQPSNNTYVANGPNNAGNYGGYNTNNKSGGASNNSSAMSGNSSVPITAGGGNKYRR